MTERNSEPQPPPHSVALHAALRDADDAIDRLCSLMAWSYRDWAALQGARNVIRDFAPGLFDPMGTDR